MLANAAFMAEHMSAFGWNTVVVDIQWYEPNARAGGYNDDADVVLDAFGRPQPAENRFPGAAGGAGFRPLADAVHELGLSFGLHIMRGVPRRAAAANLPLLGTDATIADIADHDDDCRWNSDNWGVDWTHPDAPAYYTGLADMFAEWGVDFVKADDMLHPYHRNDIEALSAALAATGREIVLSLSPGISDGLEHAEHVAANGSMWRVSGDLWDRWEDVHAQFALMAAWAPLSRPGAWADADMLPLGHIGISAERGVDRMSLLTPAEQQTLMTLWSITRSPLMMGGDLPTSGVETLALLTNRGVLEVNANATSPAEKLRTADHLVWTADLDRDLVVAVFAIADDPVELAIGVDELGLEGSIAGVELWSGDAVAVQAGQVRLDLPAHGAALIRFPR